MTSCNFRPAYVHHLLRFIDDTPLKPFKIFVDSGNGTAGQAVDAMAPHLPFRLVRIRHESDGSFPNGIPNPLLPENRRITAAAVRDSGADLGVAWVGDFDRCFLFDEYGEFVDCYYVVGLLAHALLQHHPGQKIIHDPRLTWNTIDIGHARGGIPVQSKAGHAFIKARMRKEDALYGGEMSAHQYFRDFAYCHSGMLPWLLVTRLVSETGQPLSALVRDRQDAYPVSGEINCTVRDAQTVTDAISDRYRDGKIDRTDGLSVEDACWRFNVRQSNTEHMLRLDVESRRDATLMEHRTRELLRIIDPRSEAVMAMPRK